MDLCRQSIGGADARLLSSALRQQPTLRPHTLDLSGNPLGAEAASVTAAAADCGVPLEHLRLSAIDLHALGAVSLIAALRRLVRLRVGVRLGLRLRLWLRLWLRSP